MTPWVDTAPPKAASSLIDINLSPAKTKELADALTEKLGLPSPAYLIDKFTVSGKTFEFWSNINMTCFIIGPLVLLPLIDGDLFYPGKSKHNLKGFDVQKMVKAIVKDKLIKAAGELYLNNRSNVLLVSPFSAVPGQPVDPYSALTIAGMLAAADSFKGATIIDAGSGSGRLSLVALGLGANAILIENDDMELQLAKAILETQGLETQRYKEGKDFIRIKENLEIKPKKLTDRLKNTGLTLNLKQLIGVANIGPIYGKANYKAIELFIKLGVIQIFNGGYTTNVETGVDSREKNSLHLNELDKIERILKLSYNVQRVITPMGYGFISAVLKTIQPLQTNKNQAGDTPTPPENSSSAVTHDSSVRAYEKFFKDYFLVPRTVKKVLNSLGNFENELIIKKIGKFECINFNLNQDGKSSLKELLDLESIDAKARLLYKRTAGKNLKESIEMAGILFKEPGGNKIFFLNITDLSTGYNKQNRFYDEGINPDCGRMAYTASLQLFPEINNPEIKVIRLKREALTRYLSGPYDTYFTSPFELEMLVLEDETGKDLDFIFFPSDPFSQDFQISLHGLHKKTRLFQSKRIVEIGAGTGVNNLLGLKFGAKTVKAIDTSRLYVLLAHWNIEFAKETGQVEETSVEQVEINPGNSFNSISSIDSDIYLFNSPSIRGKEELDKYSRGERTLKTIGNFMLTDDFMALFEQQKEILLSNPNAVAIWRILPSEDSGLKKVNEAELTEFEGPLIKARDRTLLKSKAMGKKFLKESGLAFTELSPTIYMLYSPSAKLSGSPFIPNTEKEPVKPNPSSGFGGIDFRNLPIVTQARSNLSANIAGSAITRLNNIDLNQEWLDIQNLTRSGITPSPERIKEYLQGLCLKDDYSGEKAENIILCLADILRLEEENYLTTDALLKDILIVLSSTNDTPELKEAFLGKAVK